VNFFLDNNLPPRTARALDALLQPADSAVHLKDEFPPDTSDVEWMQALARRTALIIISGDVNISRNPHEVRAWKEAGHTIFFLRNGWTNLQLWEQAAKLFHLFPEIIKRAKKAKRGSGFMVPLRGTIEDLKL
jgi:hypothetical protein